MQLKLGMEDHLLPPLLNAAVMGMRYYVVTIHVVLATEPKALYMLLRCSRS